MVTNTDIRIPTMSFRSNGIMFYEVNSNLASRQRKSSAFNANASKLVGHICYDSDMIAKAVEQGKKVSVDDSGREYIRVGGRERYVGFVTDGIKKRMKKCITILLQATPWTYKINPITGKTQAHKLSFITLTTPTNENSYSAKFCHKHLLEPFLRELRRKHNLKSYIWKVELQSNKQVHYHITADIVMHHRTMRNIWNSLLRKHGMLEDFKAEHGHDDPNSTDIHKVYHVKNLEAYLVKYICKEYQNEDKLDGKIWDASQNIKQADYFKTELDFPFHQYVRQLQDTLMVKTVYFEKAIFLDFKTNDYYTFFSDTIINQFFKHLKSIQSWKKSLDTTKRTLKQISTTITKDLKPVGEICRQTWSQLTLPFYQILRPQFQTSSLNDSV